MGDDAKPRKREQRAPASCLFLPIMLLMGGLFGRVIGGALERTPTDQGEGGYLVLGFTIAGVAIGFIIWSARISN